MMMNAYRSDIDGLRALAVIAVVVYHAQFALSGGIALSGGFIGVDVFFVISGYLITGILMKQAEGEGISIWDFYAKRTRRILPALLVVVLCTTVTAWIYMLPSQLEAFGQSALGALGFVSNIVFAFEDAYNADASELKPLLHTWSLGIEGQFYLIFPLIVLLFVKTRVGDYALGIIVVGLGVSLLYAEAMSQVDQIRNFFLLPSRAWQLLAGAVLAILEVQMQGRRSETLLGTAMPSVGLILVFYAIVFFDDEMLLPALLSAIPVAGAMLMIWFARPGEMVTDLLSSRPVAYVGRISYSFYLWHFSIFAFLRITGEFEDIGGKLAAIALSGGLAVVTYHFVERPFRDRRRIPGLAFAVVVGIPFLVGLAVQGYVMRSDGAPQRLGVVAEYFEATEFVPFAQNGRQCRNRSFGQSCGIERNGPIVMLVGDSHAYSLAYEFHLMGGRHGWTTLNITSDGCRLLAGLKREPAQGTFWTPERAAACQTTSQELDAFLRDRSEQMTIVYFARLPLMLEGTGFDNGEGGVAVWPVSRTIIDREVFPRVNTLSMATSLVLNKWQRYGHNVIIVEPYPEMGWNVPQQIRRALNGIPLSNWEAAFAEVDVSISAEVVSERFASSQEVLDRLPENGRTWRIDPRDWLCDADRGRCSGKSPDGIYYRDDNHPSTFGARLIIGQVEEIITTGIHIATTDD